MKSKCNHNKCRWNSVCHPSDLVPPWAVAQGVVAEGGAGPSHRVAHNSGACAQPSARPPRRSCNIPRTTPPNRTARASPANA